MRFIVILLPYLFTYLFIWFDLICSSVVLINSSFVLRSLVNLRFLFISFDFNPEFQRSSRFHTNFIRDLPRLLYTNKTEVYWTAIECSTCPSSIRLPLLYIDKDLNACSGSITIWGENELVDWSLTDHDLDIIITPNLVSDLVPDVRLWMKASLPQAWTVHRLASGG